MKKLPLSALIAASLLLTACGGDSQEATDSAPEIGSEEQVSTLTQEYNETTESIPEATLEPADPVTELVKDEDGHLIGSQAEIAENVEQYHQEKQYREQMKTPDTAILISPEGHIIGGPADIEAKRQAYHEKMKTRAH